MDAELREFLCDLKNDIKNVNNNLNEKFELLKADVTKYKEQVDIQDKKIKYIEKEMKKRNFIIFGLPDSEKNYYDLEDETFKRKTNGT